MKTFKIKIKDGANTSLHRWVPDPHRRNTVIPSKKIYDRKGQPKTGPSDCLG